MTDPTAPNSGASPTVCLTIDGRLVRCPPGSTIYEAATDAGIHIPTFCHHPNLTPVGACRMCMVEIEGVRGLQTSCTTPVREGMVVKVHTSPAAVKQRRAVIEFLLTNHPLDCPVCDKGGECPLQDQAVQDGPGQSRYVEEKRHKSKRYPLGELIVLDQERCVLCWRCIRFLDEWAGDHELDLFGRGAETRLDTFPGRPLRSKWQGNTIDVCPVGALTSRVFRFEARAWELTDTHSICPLCPVGCNIVLGVKNNELRRIVPRVNGQVNGAWMCDRGRFAHGFVDHPDRLKTPFIRRNGQLQPATWDEALDLVARRLADTLSAFGPQAVAGLGSTRVTNEANFLFQRFMRAVAGTNSVDHLGRMPAGAAPLQSLPDLEHRDVILLLGLDPSTEAPLVELWIKKAVLRHGATVVIAHPRRIELSGCGPWLGYRPGGEVALLDDLARAVIGTAPALRASPPASLSPGASTTPLQQAVHLLAGAQRPIILYGPSWAGALAAGTKLPIEAAFIAEDNNTLGALDMGVVPDLLPGRQPFDDKTRSRLAGLWGGKVPPLPGLDFDGMMAAARHETLKALWIMGADPAAESRLAGETLGQIPFLVVQDLFMTDTASIAEVVLPAASFAEVDGTFVNLTGRWQALRAAMRPPGHRPGSGTPQARPDWWIVVEVARRMADAKRQRAWEFSSVADVLAEISKVLPGARDLDLSALGSEGWQPPAPASPKPGARRSSAPVQAGPSTSQPPPSDPDYPLILVTGRLLYDRGTLLSRSEVAGRLAPAAFVMIHPTDAARFGLTAGDEVSVESPDGRLDFTLAVSDEIVPGCAYAPFNLTAAPLSMLLPERRAPARVRIRK